VQTSSEVAIRWVSVYGDEVAQPSRAERHLDIAAATVRPMSETLIQWVSVYGDELLACATGPAASNLV
jgi:hypothetical protein